jgi:predicted DNA-binding transcriptional regulator AlpA
MAQGHAVNDLPESALSGPEAARARWTNDKLLSIQDIRKIFGLGRTAAYELTHRPEFPEPVRVSPRCYRWWASEVDAFAAGLHRDRTAPSRRGTSRRAATHLTPQPAPPRHITGKIRAARTRKEAT